MVFGGIGFRQVVIHTETVQIPPSLSHIIVADLYPVLAGIHIAEIAETFRVQVLVAFAAGIIGLPDSDIAAEGE